MLPMINSFVSTPEGAPKAMRCINIVNFIRGVEPRFETDLLLPVQKQMDIIVKYGLPATWLLQFDAMVAGPFVEYLKTHMPKSHEVGFWFEMNEMLCKAAQVEWRGRKGFEWDHFPPIAFTIGYTQEERIKLADTAMKEFKAIWGQYPKSIASWNLDSVTIEHLSKNYGVDAYAVCRDQIATDGFTIWGAPIAGYYPSKKNCWSPALDRKNQISTPIFRMLGQDPVHYYNNGYKLPDGRVVREPDTMEPVWTSGRSHEFNEHFLEMISETETMKFAYAQIGQENSFPWRDQEPAYERQIRWLTRLIDETPVHIETMGDSGRRFKKAFATTPTQSQIMLKDPYENKVRPQASIWYQSRFYRANLHLVEDLPYLRDITVYSDENPQPYLTKATRENDVEQRMPAVMDGYHWSKNPGRLEETGAGAFFESNGQRLRMTGKPEITEKGDTMVVKIPVQNSQTLEVKFEERRVSMRLIGKDKMPLTVAFEWDPTKMALPAVQPRDVAYHARDFDYKVKIANGEAKVTTTGWTVTEGKSEIALILAQAR